MTDARTLENCPSGSLDHDWTIADVDDSRLVIGSAAVVEVCSRCHAIKRDADAEVVGDG